MTNLFGDEKKLSTLHELIVGLYEEPFDDDLVFRTLSKACAIADTQYFGFVLHPPRKDQRMGFITNNEPDFMKKYLGVKNQDYLIKIMIETGNACDQSRIPDNERREFRGFNSAMLEVRPISDIIYLPIIVDDSIRGHWSLARAGLSSPKYCDHELEAFNFISSFLRDAFSRSLLPAVVEDSLAFLDYGGRLVLAGARIRSAFEELFPVPGRLASGSERLARGEAFSKRYRRFLHGPPSVGMDRIAFESRGRVYEFAFSLLRRAESKMKQEGIPFASIRLLGEDEPKAAPIRTPLPVPDSRYDLTERELEVLRGIYAGKSNKVIALDLGIDEGTVKRHTHGIYEKTGYHSRVELVLNLQME
jgi:DNA-binding CsgD family transcriptional regulator